MGGETGGNTPNPWVTSNLYSAGAQITFGGWVYTCVVQHTSSSDFNTDIANWSQDPASNTWVSGQSYDNGESVVYAGVTYYHKGTGASSTPPDNDFDNWSATAPPTVQTYTPYVAGDAYAIYTLVTYNSVNYAAINTIDVGASTDPSGEPVWARLWEEGAAKLEGETIYYDINKYVYTKNIETGAGSEMQVPTNTFFYDLRRSWVAGGQYLLNNLVLYDGVNYFAQSDMMSTDVPPPSNAQWSTTIYTPPPLCLTAGTRVLTPNGYVPVETLKKGEHVTVADGRDVLITYVHKSHHDNVNRVSAPYIVPAHALGENIPCNTVRLSPEHAVHIGNDCWLTPRHMEKRSDKVVQYGMGESVNYYTFKTPDYFKDNLVIEDGVAVESYGPRYLIFDKGINAYRRIPKV